MLYQKLIILFFSSMMLVSCSSMIFVEPEITANAGKSDNYKWTGPSYTGKIGLNGDFFFYGVETSLSYFKGKPEAGEDVKFKAEEYGGFIGIKFPPYFRLWASYIHDGTLIESTEVPRFQADGTQPVFGKAKYRTLTGFKGSIGIIIFPMVYFNIGYKAMEAKEGLWSNSELTPDNQKIAVYTFGVSIPIDLF